MAALEGLDFKARYVMEGFLSGLHDSPFHGFSVEFSDYRNYQPGDDCGTWTGRSIAERPPLHQAVHAGDKRPVLCDLRHQRLDGYRAAAAWGTKLKCARVLAAALSWFLLRQNDAAGWSPSTAEGGAEFIRPSQRPDQLGLMLRELDLLGAGGARLAQFLQQTDAPGPPPERHPVFRGLLEPSGVALGFKQLAFPRPQGRNLPGAGQG